MQNPYLIEGPAVISFSGGRTSGYMLRRILDAGLQPDVHVIFADTGHERQETYTFVRDCARLFGVEIHWVERPGQFTQLIRDRKMLPNPAMRFCTQELKIRPMRDWMLARGYEHWTNVVGIRADEPRRVAKMRAAEEKRKERWDIDLPLADDGITLADVTTFWEHQSFDLMLKPYEGNCDLCFLKSFGKIKNLVRERPDLAEWWAQQEENVQKSRDERWKHNNTTAVFRLDRPTYRQMLSQPDMLPDVDDSDIIECACTD